MMDLGTLVAGIRVSDEYKSDLSQAKSEFADLGKSAEKSAEGIGSKLSTAAKVGIGAAATAAGATFATGFAASLNMDAAEHKLAAGLGAGSQAAKDAGEIAGNLYANAYGESLDEVGTAVQTVMQSGALMEDASNSQIESIAGKAMSLAQVFNVDVSESMRAVGQMVRTGMVPDAEAGLDLITVAFQQLGPQAQDVLDTFTEYSGQFQKIGIDGADALGLVQQAVKAGARDTDLAADAIKEFSIRAVDGSKGAAESFTALGFDAKEMIATFAAGGPKAREAFNQVTDALAETQGRADYATIAFGLFGTQSEDLGQALGAMNLDTAAEGLGKIDGAAAKVDATMGDVAENKITSMKRGFEEWSASMVNAPGLLGDASAALIAFGSQGLMAAAAIAQIAAVSGISFATMATSALTTIIPMATATLATVGGWISMAAAAIANALVIAGAWLIAIAPIAIVIAAIVGLAYLIYKYWDDIVAATTKAWNAVWNFIKSAAEGIKNAVLDFINFVVNLFLNWTIVGLVIKHWDKIKEVIVRGGTEIIDFVKEVPGKILGFFTDLGDRLYHMLLHAAERLMQGMIDGIRSMINGVKGAVGDVVGVIRDALPFSPAKWGPLSGSGDPTIAGRKIGDMLATGLRESLNKVAASADVMLSGVNANTAIASPTAQTPPLDLTALADILRDALFTALNRAQLQIEGSGAAKFINKQNALDTLRKIT